ncbi:MAG: M50 family metallopeptidase [Patescibacteria group bacterium]
MSSLLIFVVALSVMIFAHELGHFLVAKWRGVKVEEFGIGFPPRILSKKIGQTVYSINLLPIGGFVKVWGMDEKVKTDTKHAFYQQSRFSQFLILVAGVAMNFLLAVGVFAVFYGVQGVPESIGKVRIVEVLPGSPAETSGLTAGLEIDSVVGGDQRILTSNNQEFVDFVNQNLDQPLTLYSEDQSFVVTPRSNPPEGQGALGVVIIDSQMVKPALIKRIPLGVWQGIKEGLFWGVNIILGLGQMIVGLFRGQAPTDIAGPIGIYETSNQILNQSGLGAVIHFFAVVSVNLAVVNLLPIPAADGWHLGILALETVRGKEVSRKTKRKVNQIGMVIILTLFVLILLADVKRFLL